MPPFVRAAPSPARHGDSAMKAILIASLLAAPLAGQTVTASAVLDQPATVSIVDASGASSSRTMPAGTTLPAQGLLNQSGALALFSSYLQSVRTYAAVQISSIASAASGRSASVGPVDVLCRFTSSTPTPVRLEVEWNMSAPAGAPVPSVEVDVHNDGMVEYRGRTPGTTRLASLTLGPTPLVVRVRMQSSSVSGYINNSVSLRVEPDSPATIAPVAGACSPILLTANPAFDGSLDLELYNTYANVPLPFQALAVLGLGAAPVQLPTPHPCLLIPT